MITAGEKQDLIDWITNLENQSVLNYLMELKNSNDSDKIYIVSDQERIAIKEGIESLENEGGVSHEDVMKMTREKYPNLFKD
ncbi:hypothetical protein [Algoriphagus sp.]|uniref:hypothetical protein n=1 Tax=Algoriphagus sp. TaxID=1872435 RepID=UPI003918E70B